MLVEWAFAAIYLIFSTTYVQFQSINRKLHLTWPTQCGVNVNVQKCIALAYDYNDNN